MVIAYGITLVLLAVYSFSILDPNITFISSDLWTVFRNTMFQFGYYHRTYSTAVFMIVIALLSIFHLYFIRNFKKFSAVRLAFVTSAILLFSYPFLSHDLFNYMFDAKIFTFYHQNPYLHRAIDFPQAPELRFMHWVHRTYPYGPSFLPLTFIPSFLGLGKFSLSFLAFKVFFAAFYLVGVRVLNKMNSQWAMFFATQPLVLIEGLVNNHNDLIAVSLGLIGVGLLHSKRQLLGRVFLLLSGGIKYVTLPYLLLQKKTSRLNIVAFGLVGLLVVYLTFAHEIQPWYFLSLFVFIPYGFELMKRLQIFFAGLLVSYYPFILYGTWGESKNVFLKHEVIILFAMINLIVLLVQRKKIASLWS